MINGINVYTLNIDDNHKNGGNDIQDINNKDIVNKNETKYRNEIPNKINKRYERNYDSEKNSFRIPPENPSKILNSVNTFIDETNTIQELIPKKL